MEEGATGKAHQFCLSTGQVEEDVVRFDAPVQDLAAAAVPHSLQHVVEQPLHLSSDSNARTRMKSKRSWDCSGRFLTNKTFWQSSNQSRSQTTPCNPVEPLSSSSISRGMQVLLERGKTTTPSVGPMRCHASGSPQPSWDALRLPLISLCSPARRPDGFHPAGPLLTPPSTVVIT